MIVTIGSVKGGVGKSLTASNLAVLRAQAGKQVLIADGDDQETLSNWSDHRTALGIATPWTAVRLRGAALRSEILKLTGGYNDIIIDVGGRDTASLRAALTVSDIFVVPFRPSSFDIWTAGKVAEIIQEAKGLNDKLMVYAFINCAGVRGSDNDDAKNILARVDGITLLSTTVGQRKAFSNATAEGLGVTELKPIDKKACDEMWALHNAIFGIIKTLNKQKNDIKKTC